MELTASDWETLHFYSLGSDMRTGTELELAELPARRRDGLWEDWALLEGRDGSHSTTVTTVPGASSPGRSRRSANIG